MTSRRICVVTGSRAEYGLLRWVMREIVSDPALELNLIVTGGHLAIQFGETWREIVADGFKIDRKVDLGLADDSPLSITQAMGRAVGTIARALTELRPEIVL